MTAFLLTWKKEKWPHENILRILGEFQKSNFVVEEWRVSAHRKIYVGAKAWLLKQGIGEKGIFGYGVVIGQPKEKIDYEGKNSYMVPVRFERLTDPLVQFLINESDVRSVLLPEQYNSQSSGNTISDQESNSLEKFIDFQQLRVVVIDAYTAVEEVFNPDNLLDARQRVLRQVAQRRGQRVFRDSLLQAYANRCAVTACPIVDILEAAHLFPYLGEATNHISNGLILRSDIHMLFDCGLLGFNHKDLTIIIGPKLEGTTYSKLKGRKLREPINELANPNRRALEKHLLQNKLIH